MKYCSDTWFILKFAEDDTKAAELIRSVRFEKDELIIPIIVVAESFRKLFEKGIPEHKIESMFNELQLIQKVNIVGLDREIAKESAKVSHANKVPLIDSIVVATGKLLKCHYILGKDDDLKRLQKRKYVNLKFW